MPIGVYERTPEIREALRGAARARSVDTGWCQVEGCDKPSAPSRVNICEKHYMRQYRRKLKPASCIKVIHRRPCPACRKRFTVGRNKQYCSRACVVAAWRAENHPSWVGDAAGYNTAHQRVRTQRGSASRHICVDCGAQAQHWSVDRGVDLLRRSGNGPYSLDTADYDPRCVSCHKLYDLSPE